MVDVDRHPDRDTRTSCRTVTSVRFARSARTDWVIFSPRPPARIVPAFAAHDARPDRDVPARPMTSPITGAPDRTDHRIARTTRTARPPSGSRPGQPTSRRPRCSRCRCSPSGYAVQTTPCHQSGGGRPHLRKEPAYLPERLGGLMRDDPITEDAQHGVRHEAGVPVTCPPEGLHHPLGERRVQAPVATRTQEVGGGRGDRTLVPTG